ncbi:hypothetical protein [Halobacterium litoreum]|uniref:Restriction endonuclease n=1 Tax=Halobacterium litoreum TaxID=2039234 RepID=A0ABD5ND26_9EURY|nr:hypothetical protein [Halobacterium litoreum]UHH13915.1 hypothetical protein LT972_02695 [Halobacterium litoreum]
MSEAPAYLREATTYLNSNGWDTSRKRVREGTFLVLGAKTGLEGEKRLLAMVVTAAAGSVTKDHLKYLLQTARKQDADTVVITAEFGIGDPIEKAAKEHGIGTISTGLVAGDSSDGRGGTQSEPSSESTSWVDSDEQEDDTEGVWTRRRLLIGGGVGVLGGALLVGDRVLGLGGGGSGKFTTERAATEL